MRRFPGTRCNLSAKVTLSAGTRLGPYEILAPIGAGGMTVASARFARSRSRGANLLPPFGRETIRAASNWTSEAREDVRRIRHPSPQIRPASSEYSETPPLAGDLGRLGARVSASPGGARLAGAAVLEQVRDAERPILVTEVDERGREPLESFVPMH
jgi:hypothetical protein